MSVEARYWSISDEKVICHLCPHGCQLKPGETGFCRTRRNDNGSLITLAYGNPVAMNIDPVEKKPLYHFFPGSATFSLATRGCNLRCLNCQNHHISQSEPSQQTGPMLSPESIIQSAIENQCQSIAYTYTDPVVFFEYTTDIARKAKEAGLHNIIVSAGYILPQPLREWCSVIDAANIDLKCFDESICLKLNGIHLAPVLKTLKELKKAGVWLEITNLLIPGWTDNHEIIRKMCQWLIDNGFEDTPLHFSRFYPAYKLSHLPPTPIETIEWACETAKSSGIRYVYPGNVPGHKAEHTFCHACGKRLITRSGYNITANHIRNGCCEFCGMLIPGRFSA